MLIRARCAGNRYGAAVSRTIRRYALAERLRRRFRVHETAADHHKLGIERHC